MTVNDNQMLILQYWKPGLRQEEKGFNKAPMWVRINGIPDQWQTKEVGWKLDILFHKCLNVIMSENGSKEGRWMKILAEIDLSKPLLRGTKLKLEDETVYL